MTVSCRDQRIAVFQTDCRKSLVTKRFRAVTAPGGLAKEWDVVFPDDLSGLIIFSDHTIPFVTDQVVTVFQFAGQSCVGMRMRVIDFERKLFVDFALAIDFDDPGRSRFRDHDPVIIKRLERVDFDTFSAVSILLTCVIGPYDFLGRRIDFDNLTHVSLDHDMPVFQDVQIVDAAPFHLPADRTIFFDDRQFAIALCNQAVLGWQKIGEATEDKQTQDLPKNAKPIGCCIHDLKGLIGEKNFRFNV